MRQSLQSPDRPPGRLHATRRRWLQAALATLAAPVVRATPAPEYLADAPVPATLSLPEAAAGWPVPAVVLLHDTLGPDPRGEPYARALLAAGLAVLELLSDIGQGETLAELAETLAADRRIDAARLGVLGFGLGAASAAVAAAPYSARALLYPGCAALAAAVRQAPGPWARLPVLLLHGTADPANPPAACAAAAAALTQAGARMRRLEYRGASYAWDHPGFGAERRLLLPAPQGGRVESLPWPALAALSADQVTGFFVRELAS